MRLLPSLCIAAVMAVSCAQKPHLSDYVDTSYGVTDKHASNCVIGPMLPYGSINPSPQSEKGTSDGYNPRTPIRGFGQMHVSGTGWPTYGNFLVSPMTGLSTALLSHEAEHTDLITKPYLFETNLDSYGIRVEATAAHYSAMYRFTFPETDLASLVFDASHSIAGDIFPKAAKTLISSESSIDPAKGEVRMKVEMVGGWPEAPHTLYCVARFDKADISEAGSWFEEEYGSRERKGIVAAGQQSFEDKLDSMVQKRPYGHYPGELQISSVPYCNDHVGSYCSFKAKAGEQVLLKLATSFTSYERAAELLEAEIPGWDFDRVRDDARRIWDRKLASVKIETDNIDDKTLFYTSLYRVFTFAHSRPLDRPDASVTRKAVARAQKGLDTEGVKPYWDDNYAYWDTFRTAYPMLALLDQECWLSNLEALCERFETRGGVWDSFVAGQDRKTDQGGNDVDIIIVDGYVKDIPGADWERAYNIIKHDADNMRMGKAQEGDGGAHRLYRSQGWIPACTMSSSQTLEFAYNDWCAAQMASGLGHGEDAAAWLERSSRWTALWNPGLESRGYHGFIDARTQEGDFVGIDPAKFGGSWVSPFYEGRSWTYSYYVPHDMERVIELMGGPETFVERLEYGYSNRLTEYDNEPGFLTLRSFSDAGRPDLSSIWAHKLMDKGFSLKKGYPDNEDTGSMSSWYVFCAIGLFPDAGQDFYYLNAPRYPRITLKLPNGKKLVIESNAAPGRTVIESCEFNGREVALTHEAAAQISRPCIYGPYSTSYPAASIRHADIMQGGTLKMVLREAE